MKNSQHQQRWRDAQKAKGLKAVNWYLTEEEKFYLSRVLYSMRLQGSVPATMRTNDGRMLAVDL